MCDVCGHGRSIPEGEDKAGGGDVLMLLRSGISAIVAGMCVLGDEQGGVEEA